MITDGDHVLVQNKILKDHTTGITFPGGHVEANEPITDSLIREVYEETGLTISDPPILPESRTGSKKMVTAISFSCILQIPLPVHFIPAMKVKCSGFLFPHFRIETASGI